MNQLSIKRNVIYFSPVFRIHLILMWIQVICCRIFFKLIFMLKLYEPFRNQEIFIIYLFSIVQSRIRENKSFFFAVFGWNFALWIRISTFCGSGSRKTKSCGSNGSGSKALISTIRWMFTPNSWCLISLNRVKMNYLLPKAFNSRIQNKTKTMSVFFFFF